MDYDCFELVDMDNSEYKANFNYKNMICWNKLRLCTSLKDSAFLRGKKDENQKDVHEREISKLKRVANVAS